MEAKEEQPWPSEEEAKQYLADHKIVELFNNLTSQLIYHQPEGPKEFLIEQIEKLQKSRTTNMDHPCLFDESNIQSVFGMLDPTGRGYITVEQYKEALKTLGIQNFDEKPQGAEANKISLETFAYAAKTGLTQSSATFVQQ